MDGRAGRRSGRGRRRPYGRAGGEGASARRWDMALFGTGLGALGARSAAERRTRKAGRDRWATMIVRRAGESVHKERGKTILPANSGEESLWLWFAREANTVQQRISGRAEATSRAQPTPRASLPRALARGAWDARSAGWASRARGERRAGGRGRAQARRPWGRAGGRKRREFKQGRWEDGREGGAGAPGTLESLAATLPCRFRGLIAPYIIAHRI